MSLIQQQDGSLIDTGSYQDPSQFSKVNIKDDSFLQWFLENKQGIENLKYLWKGYERDALGRWVLPLDDNKRPSQIIADKRRLMNEQGIHWATSVMENYLDKVFQSTNWNDEHMNYEMRKAYRVVWFAMMTQYRAYKISKVNTYGIASQILSRIHAMLLASRGDGLRRFIGTTQQVTEQRIVNSADQRGFFSGITGMFRKKEGGY